MSLNLVSFILGNNSLAEWLQILSIVTNSAVLLLAFKVVRHTAQIEFKVDLMWDLFMKKFGSDDVSFERRKSVRK